jgi:hypothetical protein
MRGKLPACLHGSFQRKPFGAVSQTYRQKRIDRFANVAEWADEMANRGIIVKVAALDGHDERDTFPNIVECVSISERVKKKLDSVCPITGLPAPFSTFHEGKGIPISSLGLLKFNRKHLRATGRRYGGMNHKIGKDGGGFHPNKVSPAVALTH